MESQQEQRAPPPAYSQHQHEQEHDPESLHLPSVPTHTLPPHHNGHLPSIKSLDLPSSTPDARFTPEAPSSHPQILHMSYRTPTDLPTLPPLHSAAFPRLPDTIPRTSSETDIGSPMDTASVVSTQDDASRRRELSVLSVDDPDVRLAAEALSGLGNPDFARSPTARSLVLPRDPSGRTPEPLLSLITSNHPWLGGTINNSISAYNATKGYSPRFVKYGAELIERNIGSPVVNSVSSVGRRTGVEKSLRRYLGESHRRPSDLEQGDADAARKRQRIKSPTDSEAMDLDESVSSRTRGGSQSSYAEPLPAYDDQRSPKYEENATAVVVVDPVTGKQSETESSSSQDRRVNWSTQLIMTTSGLGVALSDTSLRSLKKCLSFLRFATKHIDRVMHALKLLLEDYEAAIQNRRRAEGANTDSKIDVIEAEQDEHVRNIANRMKSLSTDIWKTIQNVVSSVSIYTGGALPQNASQVVRTQLLSVPRRWQSTSQSAAGGETAQQGDEALGANRMLAFAKEGLNMIGEITKVVDGTVQSAENWLNRIGRKTPQDPETQSNASHGEKSGYMILQKEVDEAME